MVKSNIFGGARTLYLYAISVFVAASVRLRKKRL